MFTAIGHTPESATSPNKLKKIKAYKIYFLSITIKLEIKNNTSGKKITENIENSSTVFSKEITKKNRKYFEIEQYCSKNHKAFEEKYRVVSL